MPTIGTMTDEVAVGSTLIVYNNAAGHSEGNANSATIGRGAPPPSSSFPSQLPHGYPASSTPLSAVAAGVLATVVSFAKEGSARLLAVRGTASASSTTSLALLRTAAAERRRFGVKIAILISILVAIFLAFARRAIGRLVGGRRRDVRRAIAHKDVIVDLSAAPSPPASSFADESGDPTHHHHARGGAIAEGLGANTAQKAPSVEKGYSTPSRTALGAAAAAAANTDGAASELHFSATVASSHSSSLSPHPQPHTERGSSRPQQHGPPAGLTPSIKVAFSESPALYVRSAQVLMRGAAAPAETNCAAEAEQRCSVSRSIVGVAEDKECGMVPHASIDGAEASDSSPMPREDTSPPPSGGVKSGAAPTPAAASENATSRSSRQPSQQPQQQKQTSLVPLRADQPLVSNLKNKNNANTEGLASSEEGPAYSVFSLSSNGSERRIRFSDEPTPLAEPMPTASVSSAAKSSLLRGSQPGNGGTDVPSTSSSLAVSGSISETPSPSVTPTTPTEGAISEKQGSDVEVEEEEEEEEDETPIIKVANRFGALAAAADMDAGRRSGKPSRSRTGEGCDRRRERKAEEAAAAEKEAEAIILERLRRREAEEGGRTSLATPTTVLPPPSNASATGSAAATLANGGSELASGSSSTATPAFSNFSSAPPINTTESPYSNIRTLSLLCPKKTPFTAFRDALVRQPSRAAMALPDFIMLVGIPGSGKSTWAKEYIARMNAMADAEEARLREKEAERALQKASSSSSSSSSSKTKTAATDGAAAEGEREREKDREREDRKKEKKDKKDREKEREKEKKSKSSASSLSSSSSSPTPLAKRYVLVSSDAVRTQLMGAIDNQTQNGLVWEVVLGLCQAHLRAGTSVILDGTNVDTERRRRFLKRLVMGDAVRLTIEGGGNVGAAPPSPSSSSPTTASPLPSVSVFSPTTPAAVAAATAPSASNSPDPKRTAAAADGQHLSAPPQPSLLRKTSLSPNGSMRSLLNGNNVGAGGGGVGGKAANRYVSGTAAATVAAGLVLGIPAVVASGATADTHELQTSAGTSEAAASSDAATGVGVVVSPTTASSLLQRAEAILLGCGGCTAGLIASIGGDGDERSADADEEDTASASGPPSPALSSSSTSAPLSKHNSYHHQPIDCNRLLKIVNTNKVICKRRIRDDIEAGVSRSNVPTSVVDLMATQLAEANGALLEERWISMV